MSVILCHLILTLLNGSKNDALHLQLLGSWSLSIVCFGDWLCSCSQLTLKIVAVHFGVTEIAVFCHWSLNEILYVFFLV